MNRSGQQSADMDADKVPIEGLSVQSMLQELQALERGWKWSHYQPPIIFCAIAVLHLIVSGSRGVEMAVSMALVGGVMLMISWEQRNNERLRVVQKLLSEVVARQDAAIQKLEQVNTTKTSAPGN